jgi:hypothetical protein
LERLRAGHLEAIRAVLGVFEHCEQRWDAEDAGIFLRMARGELAVSGIKRLLLQAIEHRRLLPEIAAEIGDGRLAEVLVDQIFQALGNPSRLKELCLELSRFPAEIQAQTLKAKARADLLYSESISREGTDAVSVAADHFLRMTPLKDDNLGLNAKLRKCYREALQDLARERGQKFAVALLGFPEVHV